LHYWAGLNRFRMGQYKLESKDVSSGKVNKTKKMKKTVIVFSFI
jgi:hypothetical protein